MDTSPFSIPCIQLDWNGLPETNTLPYYKKIVNYCRKSFSNIGASGQCYKTFCGHNYVDIGVTQSTSVANIINFLWPKLRH